MDRSVLPSSFLSPSRPNLPPIPSPMRVGVKKIVRKDRFTQLMQPSKTPLSYRRSPFDISDIRGA